MTFRYYWDEADVNCIPSRLLCQWMTGLDGEDPIGAGPIETGLDGEDPIGDELLRFRAEVEFQRLFRIRPDLNGNKKSENP